VIGLDDLALNLVCPSTVVSQTSSAQADISLGHAEGLAIVQGFDSCELIEVLFEEVGELHEVSPSLLWGDSSPCSFKGLPGSGNGVVDVFLRSFVDGYDGLFVARVDALERLAILAFHKLVVDETMAVMVSMGSWWG